MEKTIAVGYLARGADKNWMESFKRFRDSYLAYDSGIDHTFYVIFKGFACDNDLKIAERLFKGIDYHPIYLTDKSLDVGAYIEWAKLIDEKLICVFNTASEILSPDWLLKYKLNLMLHNVGLVGATASYESLYDINRKFHVFPNIHIRSTGFMIDRELFNQFAENINIVTKEDAWLFESGPESLTRYIINLDKQVLLVGRNGRGYPPRLWPISDTFRQGNQYNLLIADNQTRNFEVIPVMEKRASAHSAWGKYIYRIGPSFL